MGMADQDEIQIGVIRYFLQKTLIIRIEFLDIGALQACPTVKQNPNSIYKKKIGRRSHLISASERNQIITHRFFHFHFILNYSQL